VLPPGFYNQVDKDIYAAGDFFIPQERFRAAPYTVNQPTNPDEVPAGIPAIYQSQGGGGGGALQAGGINYDSFAKAGFDAYAKRQPTPLVNDLYQSKLDKTFMGFPSYKEQQLTGPDMGEYIASGTDVPLELTKAGKIQQGFENVGQGLSSLKDKFGGIGPISAILGSMDKFDTLPALDQQFIKQSMGYRGPTVFGENTGGGYVDPFGVNVRSAFGNYAEKVRDDFSGLEDSLTGRLSEKYGAQFNPETGLFESDDEELAALANKNTTMMRKKYLFRQKQIKQQAFDEEIAAKKEAEEARLERERVAAVQGLLDEGSYVSRDSGGYSASDRAVGGGREATNAQGQNAAQATAAGTGTSQGYSQHYMDGGRVYYMDGGLADMLEIYD
jgi:hypothetical protein